MYAYVCIYVCMNVCKHVCKCVFMNIFMYVFFKCYAKGEFLHLNLLANSMCDIVEVIAQLVTM